AGTAGFRIDSCRPAYLRHLGCRYELTVRTIDHVEVTVLVRLHDDLAVAIVDSNIREHQMLNGVVVPFIAGRALIVPLQLTGVGIDGDDGGDVEIVERLLWPAAVTHVL